MLLQIAKRIVSPEILVVVFVIEMYDESEGIKELPPVECILKLLEKV